MGDGGEGGHKGCLQGSAHRAALLGVAFPLIELPPSSSRGREEFGRQTRGVCSNTCPILHTNLVGSIIPVLY